MWKILSKEEALEYIKWLPDEVILEVTKKQKKAVRSIAQSNYYWWVVIEYISDFIWLEHNFEKMELHKQIKDAFQLKTTTNLDTAEFSQMVNERIAWYREHRNLIIPKPNEHEDFVSLCESMGYAT